MQSAVWSKKWLACHGALVLLGALAACGGGGGGSTASPTETASYAGPVTVILPNDNGSTFWLAYQDGDGPWKLAPAGSGTVTVQIQDPAGRYGFVLVDDPLPPNSSYVGITVSNVFLTRQESAKVDFGKASGSGLPYASVRGSFSGASTQAKCTVSLKAHYISSVNPCSTYSIASAVPGITDAIATHSDPAGVVDSLVVKRGVEVIDGATIDFDFSSGPSLLEGRQHASFTGADRGGADVSFNVFWTSGRATAYLSQDSTGLAYPTVGANARLDGDVYSVSGTYVTSGPTPTYRVAGYQSKSGIGQALEMPRFTNPMTVSYIGSAAGIRPVMSWSPMAGNLLSQIYAYPSDNLAPAWDFAFSKGWMKGAAAVTYTYPDLSPLGWNSRWSLRAGATTTIYFYEGGTNVPYPEYFGNGVRQTFVDNTFWSSGTQTTVTVPAANGPLPMMAVPVSQSVKAQSTQRALERHRLVEPSARWPFGRGG